MGLGAELMAIMGLGAELMSIMGLGAELMGPELTVGGITIVATEPESITLSETTRVSRPTPIRASSNGEGLTVGPLL
jgi:hypothetical protein